jgi:hypothetical protein
MSGRWAELASACAWSVALVGLEGRIVEVEADIGAGLPRTVLVGLPDSALYQARDRWKAAVSNSGQEWPISLLTINLSPATLPKAGSHYDLAIVAAVLAAQGVFAAEELRRTVLLEELGLDGRLHESRLQRPVRDARGHDRGRRDCVVRVMRQSVSPGRAPSEMIWDGRTERQSQGLVKRVVENLLPAAQAWGLRRSRLPVAAPGTVTVISTCFATSFQVRPWSRSSRICCV